MNKDSFEIRTIGQVEIDEQGFAIRLAPEYRSALQGLEGFSHAQLLWWAHGLDTDEYRAITELPRPYKAGPEVLGVYATRSPLRPNPIAVTNAAILGLDVDEGVLRVAFIDAENGTPVIDIKPYHPSTERVRDAAVPQWCADWPGCLEESAEFDWASVFENAQV